MNTMVLNDGTVIPTVGFRVFQIPNDGSTYRAVRQALEIGYRHIDTAAAYFNEAEVGQAVRRAASPGRDFRHQQTLASGPQLWGAAKAGIQASLDKLGLGVHRPLSDSPALRRRPRRLEGHGGGQNHRKASRHRREQHDPKIWNTFVPQFTVQPAVNQVEFNPFFQQRELRSVMAQEKTKLEAYFPWATEARPAHPSGGHRSGGEISQDSRADSPAL